MNKEEILSNFPKKTPSPIENNDDDPANMKQNNRRTEEITSNLRSNICNRKEPRVLPSTPAMTALDPDLITKEVRKQRKTRR